MSLSLWALLLMAFGGILLSLGVIAQPDVRYRQALVFLSLVLFTASAVLALVVAGQT